MGVLIPFSDGPSHCLVPEHRVEDLKKKINGSCEPSVRCKVLDPYDVPNGVLADAECRLEIGDPATTFSTYFVIRYILLTRHMC